MEAVTRLPESFGFENRIRACRLWRDASISALAATGAQQGRNGNENSKIGFEFARIAKRLH
ncbi:hypothetical protein AU476_13685 [Cupriavidus sp. UYMSc13B]|nr:hypothetical protein AU476_13685 [Cupriavidus sp. UYMSc13B]